MDRRLPFAAGALLSLVGAVAMLAAWPADGAPAVAPAALADGAPQEPPEERTWRDSLRMAGIICLLAGLGLLLLALLPRNDPPRA